MRNIKDTLWWKIAILVLEISVLAAIAWGILYAYSCLGYARAEPVYEEAYILCSDYVYVRRTPSRKSTVLGQFECGEKICLDGKKKNGYLHCVDLRLEENDGWIHSGFIVYEKPQRVNCSATIVSKGRLAARKHVGGKRTRWLKPDASLKVYYWTEEWALTNCGYVQSDYLELGGSL